MNRRIVLCISFIGLNLMACWCGGAGPQPANPVGGPAEERRVVLGGDVTISIIVIELADRRVKVKGITNLPENTEFVVTIEETMPGFIGGSKCKVRANGGFETEIYGPKTGLPDGIYTAQVVMPWTLLQPADVQKITGNNGENLTGPLIQRGPLGVSLTATKDFSIGGPQAAQQSQLRVKQRFEAYQKLYERIVALEKRLQDARERQLRRDENSWVPFAQKLAPDLTSVHTELSNLNKLSPLLPGHFKVSAPLSDLENMFLATAFRQESKYAAAEKQYRLSISELKEFLAGVQPDREDAATITAYEKLGAVYGGWMKGKAPWGFQAGHKHAREGLLAFQLEKFPKSKLPDVGVPFGLELYKSDVTDEGLKRLANLANLVTLSLNATQVTDAGLKELTPLKNLTELYLEDTKVTDAGLKELATLNNLSALFLDNTNVTNVGLKELTPFKHLTTLSLLGTNVTDAGLKGLAPLENLTMLGLGGTKLTDAGLKELAPLKNLTMLGLGSTKVTDAGLKELAPLKNLARLNLSETKVTDAGLKELALLKNLTNLYLEDTKVTDAGLKDLTPLKNLATLGLSGTKVTDAGIAELRKALPKCEIIR